MGKNTYIVPILVRTCLSSSSTGEPIRNFLVDEKWGNSKIFKRSVSNKKRYFDCLP